MNRIAGFFLLISTYVAYIRYTSSMVFESKIEPVQLIYLEFKQAYHLQIL